MNTEFLDPEKTLQDFFLLNRAFAFHDQIQQPNQFTYGCATPEIVLDNQGVKISALHLINSPGGGLASFISPNLPVDTIEIKEYIKQHITHSNSDVVLTQCDISMSVLLRFINPIDDTPYLVPFVQSKMALMHDESNQLSTAIQGAKNKVYVITQTEFTVNSRVSAELDADWVQFLILAFNKKAKQPVEIAILLNEQIDAGIIILKKKYDNTPSQETIDRVRYELVNVAAILVSNTLKNVNNINELPTKVNYLVSYSDSLPQKYLLEYDQDIAPLLSLLPYDSIVSFDPNPLPEPSRKPDKPVEKQCVVSLGFNATSFNILSIELSWSDKKVPMQWPTFPPITLSVNSDITEITLKVNFSDYSIFENKLPWQKEIKISTHDIGFNTVMFDARHLKSEFKNISGNATYISNHQTKKPTFNFSFSDQQWQATWLINTHSSDLDGRIEYRWQGKTSTLWPKNYDSGVQQATASPIELQYNK